MAVSMSFTMQDAFILWISQFAFFEAGLGSAPMEAISVQLFVMDWRDWDRELANPHREEHVNEIHRQFMSSSYCDRLDQSLSIFGDSRRRSLPFIQSRVINREDKVNLFETCNRYKSETVRNGRIQPVVSMASIKKIQ
jgi:hypothetical protein